MIDDQNPTKELVKDQELTRQAPEMTRRAPTSRIPTGLGRQRRGRRRRRRRSPDVADRAAGRDGEPLVDAVLVEGAVAAGEHAHGAAGLHGVEADRAERLPPPPPRPLCPWTPARRPRRGSSAPPPRAHSTREPQAPPLAMDRSCMQGSKWESPGARVKLRGFWGFFSTHKRLY